MDLQFRHLIAFLRSVVIDRLYSTRHRPLPAMAHPPDTQHKCITQSSTSHPDNPIPEEPPSSTFIKPSHPVIKTVSPNSSTLSLDYTSGSDNGSPSTPATDPQLDELPLQQSDQQEENAQLPPSTPKKRRASTLLISQSPEDKHRILSPQRGAETKELGKVCCGGGCCSAKTLDRDEYSSSLEPITTPDNDAFRSLKIPLGPLSLDSNLTDICPLPDVTIYFESLSKDTTTETSTVYKHPPPFVTPHPPYEVYSAKIHGSRELTRKGAEKRTYHFDLDVTDYPVEGGDVDFVVGGAIGIQAPNSDEVVNELFTLLNIPKFIRDRQILLKTTGGRWPTIWGDEKARELITTRRELLTWCSDVQSYPPTKPLFRLLADYATEPNEKKILMYLAAAQGQAAFCDLRTGPHITINQILSAFPSSSPPLAHLLSVLNTLMPRFYSLSQDPCLTAVSSEENKRRLIEIAVTVHEAPNWRGGPRTGVGSGFLERIARKVQAGEAEGKNIADLDLRIPMFRGLMSNPLAREFVTDGPMLLIGAGVGIAPFRGFVQRRLKSANCANKVWVLQGVRDSLLDELYKGEWGVEEDQVKKVVQSRKGEGRYVQEEVRHQADLVWFIINALDGRVFVCGSSQGMGEGVENALVDVAMDKGKISREQAEEFWDKKKEAGQYIAVCSPPPTGLFGMADMTQETW